MYRTIHGSAHDIPLPDASVQCIVTSPPYWSLRKYSGDQGVEWPEVTYRLNEWTEPVTVAGCDPDCEHEWQDGPIVSQQPQRDSPGGFHNSQSRGKQENTSGKAYTTTQGAYCRKCGGWRGDLGLEPSPVSFVGHLILCLREWRRVLRDDGVCWVNLGDSYAGGGGYSPNSPSNVNGSLQSAGNQKGTRNIAGRIHGDTGLKSKDLCMIPAMFAMAARADGWWLRSDVIWAKCLSGGTRVYARTQKGEMSMTVGEMARLRSDTVQLWSGNEWVQVVSMEQTPSADGLEIEFRNGQRVSCTPEHRWILEDSSEKLASELSVGDVLASVTLPDPGIKPPRMLPDDDIGWFVGLYIAEGSLGKNSKVIQIAAHAADEQRFERLTGLAGQYGGTCRMHKTGGNAATINLYCPVLVGVIQVYINGTGAKGKHLSQKCWMRSNGFLSALLTGYLEGDGHYVDQTGQWRLGFTRNDALADDLRTICARLGYSIRLRRTWHKYQNGKSYGFRGNIQMNTARRRTQDWQVVGIQRSKSSRFYDIQIESPHEFALSCGLLTHNSNPMPESVTDRPTSAHEHVFLLAKASRYYYDADAVREANSDGSIARFGITGDGQTATWNTTNNKRDGRDDGTKSNEPFRDHVPVGRNLRNVWHIATQPTPFAHFATYPEKLVEPCIKAGTSARGCCPECGAPWERVVEVDKTLRVGPPSRGGHYAGQSPDGGWTKAMMGGYEAGRQYARKETGWRPTCEHDAEPVPCLTLDPFHGSGTTGIVALRLGRAYCGVDISKEYLEGVTNERMAQGAQIGFGL